MSTLPLETVAHVAHFLLSWQDRRHALVLRAASTLCRDAVQRAVRDHEDAGPVSPENPAPHTLNTIDFDAMQPRNTDRPRLPRDPRTDPRAIVARGRVFGSACRKLYFRGSSTAVLRSMHSLVLDTKGHLIELCVAYTSLTVDAFLDVCRACPRLKSLGMGDTIPLLQSAVDNSLEDFAKSVSRACPLLEEVCFPLWNSSTEFGSVSEEYAMFFENLTELDFSKVFKANKYCPQKLDRIEESARRCPQATAWDFGHCRVTQPLITRLLRTPLSSRVHTISLAYAEISSSMVLELATGCPLLRSLDLLLDLTGIFDAFDPAFYRRLSYARPELTELLVSLPQDGLFIDDCMRWIGTLKLEKLMLGLGTPSLTYSAAVIDAILSGPCAQTLSRFTPFDSSLGTSMLLSLVQGCSKLNWVCVGNRPLLPEPLDDDGARAKAILEVRGGTLELKEEFGFFDEE